jgi:hypothetical protein
MLINVSETFAQNGGGNAQVSCLGGFHASRFPQCLWSRPTGTLFMFILGANLIGLIPYSFTVTSQLIITVTFALLVFFIVVGYGFWKNACAFSMFSCRRAYRN